MFPASATRTPAPAASAAASAAVVLLPFVPLTPSTRSLPCSASHSEVAVVTGTPAPTSATSSGRCIETPGERTTTSHSRSAATAAPASSMRTPSPGSAARSLAVGCRSNAATAMRAAGRWRVSWRAKEAISLPAPQTPTRHPSSSEKRTHIPDQRLGHVVLVAQREHLRRIADAGALPWQHLGEQPADDGVIAPALIDGEQPDRSDALLLLADALERLVAAGRAQQRKARELILLGQQVAPEDRAQALRREERCERQEHEAALGAFAAPRCAAQRG